MQDLTKLPLVPAPAGQGMFRSKTRPGYRPAADRTENRLPRTDAPDARSESRRMHDDRRMKNFVSQEAPADRLGLRQKTNSGHEKPQYE